MSGQRFAAREPFEFGNGAIGWRPGGFMDCLGPYAKIQNCPLQGTQDRRTVYATGYADSYFSIPGRCDYKGETRYGFITSDSENPVIFVMYAAHYIFVVHSGHVELIAGDSTASEPLIDGRTVEDAIRILRNTRIKYPHTEEIIHAD